jgi:hypothetical protein
VTGNLREQLGVKPDPDFDMDLPPGWSRSPVSRVVLETMSASMKKRFMEAHKPQLYAEVKAVLEESFEAMRRNGAFAFFSATEPDTGTLWIPASIVASTRRAAPGESLDDLARTLIRSHGATPLLGDKAVLRFEQEKTVRMGTETIVNHSVIYLTPVPGAKRRRALQLVAGFGRTPETSADDSRVTAQKFLFDACVSTLRWRAPNTP